MLLSYSQAKVATAAVVLTVWIGSSVHVESFQPTSTSSSTISLTSLREHQGSQQQQTTPTDDDWIKQDFEAKTSISSSLPPLSNPKALLTDGPVRGPSNVLVYDTTLRDGTQMESISVSCADKLKITQRLASFNIDYIEAGWPGSNPKDEEFFQRAQSELDVKLMPNQSW